MKSHHLVNLYRLINSHRQAKPSARIGVAAAALLVAVTANYSAAYPEPAVSPQSWELKFEHENLRRIVVQTPDSKVPKAYLYLTYTVTNNTDDAQTFLPFINMVTREGKVIRSDQNIPNKVFQAIKQRTRIPELQDSLRISGALLVGRDQAKDGVAIWEEPMPEMGSFSIYVGGLSGEAVELKGDDGKPVSDDKGRPILLFKTMELDFVVNGDEIKPDIDTVSKTSERWVMR